MPRDLPIGNGSMLVAFDSQYRLADFFFPHVGMENHAASRCRFGVWADDALTWVESAEWQKTLAYLRDTLVTDVTCDNEAAGLRLRCHDAVDADANVYVRKIVVRNTRPEKRRIKLFLHHDLNLYGNAIGDTAMYDPETRGIVHYKARRYFLISAEAGIGEYACGRSGIGGAEGTWRDAEDGVLSMHPIAQGAVDSTIALPVDLEPSGTATVLYWICAGKRYDDVRKADARVRTETAAKVMTRTASYWYTWVNKPADDLADLPDEVAELYRRSLLIIRTQSDNGGAVLAANDSDITWGHNDHYSYMWARDAAFVCDAMGRAGFPDMTGRFMRFAREVIHDDGYFLHKYNPDGSFAPLWHPWVDAEGKPQLPIQEDETALVIWLIERHYQRTRDLELLRWVYDRLVAKPADFLTRFRDPATKLPLPSFDMWEERQGIFTFTCAAVWAGLHAAAEIANRFNDQERRSDWQSAADEVRDALTEHLWLDEEGRFARGLVLRDGKLELDKTVDASAFAVFYLGVFPATSAVAAGTMEAIRERLWVQTEIGGVARYENDAYHRISDETRRVPGNPWLICTLWLAEHAVARATSVAELQSALDLVRWARAKAPASLVLPEQIDPYDGQAISVAPLTWSHAQVVSVIRGYLDALRKFRAPNIDSSATSDARIDRENTVDNQ
jgi:oligosaccharide amylase